MSEQMLEALKLADAALSGANMNMNVVWKKVQAAIAQQPAAVVELTGLEPFREWLVREMPAGTVIGDPEWWAPFIYRAVITAHIAKQRA